MASLASTFDRDAVATMVIRLLIVAGGFLSSIITARWLSASGRGEYFLVITLAQGIAQFGNLGLHSSNTYVVARRPALAGALLGNSVALALVAGVVGGLVVAVVHALTGGTVTGLWFAVLLAPAILFFMLGTNLLVGLGRIHAFNRFQLASNFGVLFCLMGAALAGAGATGFLAAGTLGWSLVAIVLFREAARDAVGPVRPDAGVLRDGVGFALKAYAATLCGFMVIRSNVFLLGAVSGADQVGYFSVAAQMADVLGILPQSIALVLFPALVTAGSGQFRTTLQKTAGVAVLLGAACVGVGLLAPSFIVAVFGPAFQEAVPVVRWMLPGAFFVGLTSVLSQYLAAGGFPRPLVAIWVIGAVGSAALGSAWVPGHGAVGAATALSLTHAAIFVAVLVLCVTRSMRAGRPPQPSSLSQELPS